MYAQTKPASIQWGNAIDHNINSFQTARSLCILRAITGNIDVPGGDVLISPLPVMRAGHFMMLRDFPRKPEGMIGGEFKLAVRGAFVPRQALIKAILEEKPYPVKAVLLFNTKPLLTYPNSQEVHDALKKLEFLAVSELFMTPTAALADIVLPVAASLEMDEVSPYPPSGFLLAHPQIVEPPPECWSDMKIINELAKRLGLGNYFWADEREALDLILKPSGLSFEEFKRERILWADKGYRKYEKDGFPTPSRKVEIYSNQLEGMGYSPLPTYIEPPETPLSNPQLAKEYPFILTSGKSPFFHHSAHRNIDSLRKASPEPVVELNPDTATKLGLREGDWVYIETKRGRIKQRLGLNNHLDPRIAIASYGWWFPERGVGELFGWQEANINVLTESSPPYEPAVGSVNLRGILCRIVKA